MDPLQVSFHARLVEDLGFRAREYRVCTGLKGIVPGPRAPGRGVIIPDLYSGVPSFDCVLRPALEGSP